MEAGLIGCRRVGRAVLVYAIDLDSVLCLCLMPGKLGFLSGKSQENFRGKKYRPGSGNPNV